MAALRRVLCCCCLALTVLQSFPGIFAKSVVDGPIVNKPAVQNPMNEHANEVNDQKRRAVIDKEAHRINRQQGTAGGPLVRIAESPECSGDVKRFCGTTIALNNFALMDCLQNDPKEDEVSDECQHFLYQYKYNLTKDVRFESASFEVCKKDLEKFPDCKTLNPGEGLIIPCLMENHNNITAPHCQQFLIKMESIIFSDYRLVKPLLENCVDEIKETKCGRIMSPNAEEEQTMQYHTHGAVISCLEDKIASLKGKCRFQIMRIAELQADDYHLDRQLFYACRQDREQFCPKVAAGGGRIYQCLFKHKYESAMSDLCQQKLVARQKLIADDYKVDKTFSDACDNDIKIHNCLPDEFHHEFAKRSAVLLCLESALKSDERLAKQCVAELTEWRRNLMSDYQISPELVLSCQDEISKHCNGLGTQGKTIHCLMKMARPNPKDTKKQSHLSTGCMRELEELLKEADVGEDFRVDTALQEACHEVVNKFCDDIPPGDARVMGCLMEKLDPHILNSAYGECAEHLLEIQYFVARDFRLDHKVYRFCHSDATTLCGAPKKWITDGNTDVDPGPLVLPCLYRHMTRKSNINPQCRKEVRRVMAMRATSIDLMPELEVPCIQDLGQFCSEATRKGEEIQCLQNKFEQLTDDCQDAVGNFTEMEDADIQLDAILMKSCMPMIKRFCQEELDNEDEEDIMECLIENKNDGDMNSKCAAGIEHHQILSLKEFRFNHKFKENCKTSVNKYCKGKKHKYDVVACLSEIVRNDTLFDENHRIEKSCRRQLKFELLQRSENIEHDPELLGVCEADRKKFCKDKKAGKSEVLECLKKHHKKLQKDCRKMIFVREESEVVEGSDYTLMTACKKMIKLYCADSQPIELVACLKHHRLEPEFDQKCHRVVIERMIVQNQDYRLNPQLQKKCKQDIPKFCKSILDSQQKDDFLEGKVINCLKKQFQINRLSEGCENYIKQIIKDAARDYREDPVLAEACQNTIAKLCAEAIPDNSDNDAVLKESGSVEECLKNNFRQRKIEEETCRREVMRIVAEGKIDVHVDPLLHTACLADIRKHCDETQPGDGMVMSCLLSLLEENVKMTIPCKEKLQERKEMWELSAKIAPAESFSDVVDNMSASPSRNYFIGVLLTVVGVIFIMGLSCGRVTKRTRSDKMK